MHSGALFDYSISTPTTFHTRNANPIRLYFAMISFHHVLALAWWSFGNYFHFMEYFEPAK